MIHYHEKLSWIIPSFPTWNAPVRGWGCGDRYVLEKSDRLLLNMTICSLFIHSKRWFSIVTLVCPRVPVHSLTGCWFGTYDLFFFQKYWEESSKVTNSYFIVFQRGWKLKAPTSWIIQVFLGLHFEMLLTYLKWALSHLSKCGL